MYRNNNNNNNNNESYTNKPYWQNYAATLNTTGMENPESKDLTFISKEFMTISNAALKPFYTSMDDKAIVRVKAGMEMLLKRCVRLNIQHNVFENYDALYGVALFNKLLESQLSTNPSRNTQSEFIAPLASIAPEMIFMTCIMLGSKCMQDTPFNNKTWAMLQETSTRYLNDIEIIILGIFNFDLPTYDMNQLEALRTKMLHPDEANLAATMAAVTIQPK